MEALYTQLRHHAPEQTILLMRHGERPVLRQLAQVDGTRLTPRGRREAERLGATRLADTPPDHIFHSPVLRCRETAESLLDGLQTCAIHPVNHGPVEALFPPFTPEHIGHFMQGSQALFEHGSEAFVYAWLAGDLDTRHYPDPQQSARRLLAYLLQQRATHTGRHLHVCHDCNLLLLLQVFMGLPPEESLWPRFLEPLLLSVELEEITVCYRDQQMRIATPPSL
ncbi:MAG: histidine phosphatase family protein [Magnetococcales bacterium]|nr:histidine phosphatase family protein [Magnetococcales bacterium]